MLKTAANRQARNVKRAREGIGCAIIIIMGDAVSLLRLIRYTHAQQLHDFGSLLFVFVGSCSSTIIDHTITQGVQTHTFHSHMRVCACAYALSRQFVIGALSLSIIARALLRSIWESKCVRRATE